jgi:hypothetical protein
MLGVDSRPMMAINSRAAAIRFVIASIAIVALWLSIMPTAKAQAAALDYCYTYATYSGCFDSKAKAEAAIRAIPIFAPTGQYLQQVSVTNVNTATNEATYKYGYKLVPASQTYSPNYKQYLYVSEPGTSTNFGCAPTNSPYRQGSSVPFLTPWCISESELISLTENHLRSQSPTCTIGAFSLQTDYPSPYSSTGWFAFQLTNSYVYPGRINFGTKTFKATKTCGTSTSIVNYDIYKQQDFDCPSGFRGVEDSGLTAPNISLPNVC